MKARYVIIDEVEREEFEKEYQLPYGYSECIIHFDFDNAIRTFQLLLDNEDYVIEKIDDDGKEIVYRR